MLPTLGAPSTASAVAATNKQSGAKPESKPLSPVVLFSLMVFISLGCAFVMVRMLAEGRIGFLEDERKKMIEDLKNLKNVPAPVATGANVEEIASLTAKITALETLIATSSSVLSESSSTIEAITNLEAKQKELSVLVGDLANRQPTTINTGETPTYDAGTTGETVPVPPRVQNIDLCGSEPKILASGKVQLPVDSKYSGLDILGQVFTANNCGGNRINQVSGISGVYYTLGLGINLLNAPLGDFLIELQDIGFKCAETNREATCKKWKLDRLIELKDIYRLEPFANEIDSDACLHCN